jgi:DNA-binding response OmpR family regulator
MTSATGSPADTRRVLVVDDDPDLRNVLRTAFVDEGYEVRSATNGRSALEVLETWRPSVIVLDLMMPELDGWSFRARQLAIPSMVNVPVVILSAASDARLEALQPAAMIQKPFDLLDLLDTVAALVR